MKIHKNNTKKFLLILIAFYWLCISACMRSRKNALEEPAPPSAEKVTASEPKADEAKEGGTLSVITNLFSDPAPSKTKAKAPLSRIPFRHIGFYETPVLGDKSYNWEARVIQSEQELKDLQVFFDSQQLAHNVWELKKGPILALIHTGFKANSAIRISQVKFDEQFHILSEHLETSSSCSILSGSEPKHHLHLISIPATYSSKQVRVDVLRKYDACLTTLKWEQKKFSPVAYKTIHYESNSKKSWTYPSPRILTLSNNWGEWNLFQNSYCNSCAHLSIPNNKGFIAIVDGKSRTHEYGKIHLTVDKLYRNNHYVGISLKRVVELCEQSKPNAPLLLLQVDHNTLGIDGAFAKSNIFRLPSSFIPEDQVSCGSFQKQ